MIEVYCVSTSTIYCSRMCIHESLEKVHHKCKTGNLLRLFPKIHHQIFIGYGILIQNRVWFGIRSTNLNNIHRWYLQTLIQIILVLWRKRAMTVGEWVDCSSIVLCLQTLVQIILSRELAIVAFKWSLMVSKRLLGWTISYALLRTTNVQILITHWCSTGIETQLFMVKHYHV